MNASLLPSGEMYGLVWDVERDAPRRLPRLSDSERQWLQERLSRLGGNGEFRRALQVFRDMPKAHQWSGWTGVVNKSFPQLACLAVKHDPTRETWNRLYAHGTGKTWKALTEFPRQLRQTAADVERLNRSFSFNPELFLKQEKLAGRVLLSRCKRLPAMLHFYATIIEQHVKWLPAITREVYPGAKGFSQCVFFLSGLVKVMTGKFHDREVAGLLTAAALALGESREFDALDLAQARSRRRKKAKT
jgi:hypothetical protein